MKCTGRKDAVAQKGWLNTGTTKRRFLPFLLAILKLTFNLWSKFSPSRHSVISSSRTMLNLQWNGSGSPRYLLSESDLQSLSSCRAYTTKKSEGSLLNVPSLHLVCLNEHIDSIESTKNYLQNHKAFRSKAWPQCFYTVFFPRVVGYCHTSSGIMPCTVFTTQGDNLQNAFAAPFMFNKADR